MNILADVLYDILKQDKPNLPPTRDFDITYLYIQLRKLNKNIPSNGWGGHMIQSTDITIGDDIERIRLTRNELQHCPTFHLGCNHFFQLYHEVSDLLERFDRYNISAKNYTEELNAVMNKCMSSEDVSSMYALNRRVY